MLAVSTYDQAYIDACRAAVTARISAYSALADAARAAGADPALDDFEPLFFNSMVLALDAYFVHRVRNREGKDGNPLNEVRLLCSSIMGNGGVLSADKSIKLKPQASVLGLAAGDPIALTAGDFTRLADAFFAELEARYA